MILFPSYIVLNVRHNISFTDRSILSFLSSVQPNKSRTSVIRLSLFLICRTGTFLKLKYYEFLSGTAVQNQIDLIRGALSLDVFLFVL